MSTKKKKNSLVFEKYKYNLKNKKQMSKESKTSIIILGETGSGKSSFCNLLCENPKCKVGNELNSETDSVNGIFCDGEYNDIFIIDTPGTNDSNGLEQDNRNLNLMHNYIKENPRIKGIIILLKFTDNRITGSIKHSLYKFCDMFPMNNFWDHVVIILSHYFSNNLEEKIQRKESLKISYINELNFIMNKSKENHNNFILPDNIPIFFCELKYPDEESKNEILNAINYLRNKEQMFKKIEERIEEPKIRNTSKLGNTTIYEYYIEKITSYIDFDDSKIESSEIIDSWNEKDIEESESEVKEKIEGEKKIFEHFVYKKIIHLNKNNEEIINIDKENPIEYYIESEEMIYLPEEVNSEVNGKLTTYNHNLYKQKKFVDKNLNVTFGEKFLVENWKTYKEIIEDSYTQNYGNTVITYYRRKNKFNDKYNNVTYDEPEIYNTHRQTIVEREIYVGGGSDCFVF